eukprot:NODE_658_length_4969_cov_1.543326.p3 type:complete len:374 gc:universal NODE_658_length_4969_cov_1.543326:3309-4430(+)
MLFTTTILAHCQTTYIGLNGDFREMRDPANGDNYGFYPLDHIDRPFRKPGNWKYAVCRNTTKKSPDPLTVKPGDTLTLDFRPDCNSGTVQYQKTTVMQKGQKVQADSGDWNGGPRHKGGYCQISMTYTQTPEGVNPQWSDFVVIAQYEGRCPDATSEWDFKLPDSLPSGEAVMMWTWFSAKGRSEMYSTCWDVNVEGNTQDKGIYGFCVLYGNLNETNKFFLPVDETLNHPNTFGSMEYKGVAGDPSKDASTIAIKTAPEMGCDDTFDYMKSVSRLPTTGPFGSGYQQGSPSLPAAPSTSTETAPPNPESHYNFNNTNNNPTPPTGSEDGGPAASSPSPSGQLAEPNPFSENPPNPTSNPSTGGSMRRCMRKY